MTVGCVKEVKSQEFRVGLTPSCVAAYVGHGHTVLVQHAAGEGAGYADAAYAAAGARLLDDAKQVFDQSDMIVKVKEPVAAEYSLFHSGQILYTYLHLAAEPELAKALLETGVHSVAYETMTAPDGGLPCLRPMSEIAGRLSVQEGAKYLEKPFGGRGVLLGGVPGVPRGRVVVLGGGTVGTNACKMAVGLQADVTVLDLNPARLQYLDDLYGNRITTLYSSEEHIARCLQSADLVIGAVLIPGAAAPKLVRREHLRLMQPGAVLADVAIDQGGCIETSRPTSHHDPVYVVDGVVHYCVANMPGAVPRTSTLALTSTTLRYGLQIADQGLEPACRSSATVASGLNTYGGQCTCEPVAQALGLVYAPINSLIA